MRIMDKNMTQNTTAMEQNTSSSIIGEQQPLVMYDDVEKVVIALTWYLITIPAYIIYFFIVLVVYRNKGYHTAGYYLMVSLSASELITMSVYVLLGLPMSLAYPRFTVTRRTRDMIGTIKNFTYTASVFHMFFICINRYVSVVHFARYKQLFPNSRVIAIIVTCWMVGFVFSIPLFLGKVAYYWEPMIFGHLFDFTLPWTSVYFRFHQAFAGFILLSASYFYSTVMLKVSNSKRVRGHVIANVTKVDVGPSQQTSQALSALKEEIKLTIQFAIVTLVFILAWISISIQSQVDLSQLSLTGTKLLNAVNSCMWIMNYAVNAFVYFTINKRLRNDILLLVDKFRHSSKSEVSNIMVETN